MGDGARTRDVQLGKLAFNDISRFLSLTALPSNNPIEPVTPCSFNVWNGKNKSGRKVMGIERSTFVIGPEGKIEKIYTKVKAKGHAAEVLAGL